MSKFQKPLLACVIFILSMLFVAYLLSVMAELLEIQSSVLVLSLSSILSGVLTLFLLSELRMIRWRKAILLYPMQQSSAWAIVFFSIMALIGLNLFSEMLDLPDNASQTLSSLVFHPLGILALALVGPLVEELVFREAVTGSLLRVGVKPSLAIVFSSVAFGVIHANPAQIPFALLTGFLLGYLYSKFGNITLPFIIHAINNSVAVILILLCGEDASLVGILGNTFLNVILASSLCLIGGLGVKCCVGKATK